MERYYNETLPPEDQNADDCGDDENGNGTHLSDDNDNDNEYKPEMPKTDNKEPEPLLDMTRSPVDETANEGKFVVKVRGLPWSATTDDIVGFFNGSTTKEDGIHFLINNQGRPTGEAYIEFATDEDLQEALKKDKEYMGKRYIEVYEARHSDMVQDLKRNSPRSAGTEQDRCVLKLRGLPFSCTKEEIYDFFRGLEIVPGGITIVTDHSGRATGEAFVRFSTPEVASKAMEKHKERIGHRYVEIFASSMRELDYATGATAPPPSLFSSRGGGYGGYRDNYGAPPYYGGSHRPGPYDRAPPPSYRSRGVKGGYGDGGYGGGYGGGGGGGYGGYHDYPPYPDYGGYGGRGGPPPHHYQPPPPPSSYGRGGYGGYPPHHPPPPTVGPHRVRMRGLPFSATQQDIYEFFHPMVPTYVHFVYGSNGKFSGEVDAEFRTHEEASDAMRFDRKYINKRYIELFLYSTPSPHSSGDPHADSRGPPTAAGAPPIGSEPPNGGYAGGYQTF